MRTTLCLLTQPRLRPAFTTTLRRPHCLLPFLLLGTKRGKKERTQTTCQFEEAVDVGIFPPWVCFL